ncbi:MAG: hypothetical protein VR72_04135 [Clostridiaceae bacterium BRH_c20a]|nr:MAG: hypothetical protein VR72_04135 [Clostridiaceae bacterium BRH_c20a]
MEFNNLKVKSIIFIKVKLRMAKMLRISLITVLGLFTVFVFVLLYQAWTSPGTVEEKVQIYSYKHKGEVDYRVNLHPNPITSEESLGKGQYYLTPFVKNINTSFKYQFLGDKVADITGEYEVTAYMQGIRRELDKIFIIWNKPYILSAKETFEAKDKEIALSKELPLDLKIYNDFVAKFFKDHEIQTEVILSLNWDVRINAQTENGMIQEQLTPSITIPLNTKYFQITEDLSKSKEGVIENTVITTLPVDETKLTVYGVLAFIFIIGIILIIFKTENTIVNPVKKQWKKIHKDHGERLVALENELSINSDSLLNVKTFEDIVKVADELGKPIMYRGNLEHDEEQVFYVLNEPRIFTYRLAFLQQSTSEPETMGSGFTL